MRSIQEESKVQFFENRRQARRAADDFVKACVLGYAENITYYAQQLNETVDGWTWAMRRVGKLTSVPDTVQFAFLDVWIEHKALAREVGHRPTMAAGLRILMPRTQVDGPLRLYRGTKFAERKRRLYGFSWSTSREIARDKFACKFLDCGIEGVVLETLAPPRAVLHVRPDVGYYDEGEVIVDPFNLGTVSVNERLPPIPKNEAYQGGS